MRRRLGKHESAIVPNLDPIFLRVEHGTFSNVACRGTVERHALQSVHASSCVGNIFALQP